MLKMFLSPLVVASKSQVGNKKHSRSRLWWISVCVRHETSKSRLDPWNLSNCPEEPIDLDTFLHSISCRWFMVYASKKYRGVGQCQASGGQCSTGMGVVGTCAALRCVDHELSFSVPRWLTRGSLCGTNFAVSTVPPSGHGWLTALIQLHDQR